MFLCFNWGHISLVAWLRTSVTYRVLLSPVPVYCWQRCGQWLWFLAFLAMDLSCVPFHPFGYTSFPLYSVVLGAPYSCHLACCVTPCQWGMNASISTLSLLLLLYCTGHGSSEVYASLYTSFYQESLQPTLRYSSSVLRLFCSAP